MKVHVFHFHTLDEANCFLHGVETAQNLMPNQDDCFLGTCLPRLQEGFEDGEENAWLAAVHNHHDLGPAQCPVCGARETEDGNFIDGPMPEGKHA